MCNSSFVLALSYCLRSKLVFTSFCFLNVPKPELTSAARIMDRNSKKWSQKGYHFLPFAAKLSVRRCFEQFHTLNNRQGSFPHHSFPPCNWTIMPFLYKLKVSWPRVETRLLIALVILPSGTPDSGSKFRRNQVFIRYPAASAGLTKGNRLSKRKRNVLRRASPFLQLSITDQAWSGLYDCILLCGQIPFFAFC